MATNGRFEYTIGFKTDESGLQKAKQALKEIQSLTTTSIKGSSTQYLASDLQTAKEAAHQLESALERAGKTASGAINVSALSKELNKLPLKDLYNDLAKIGPKGTNAFRDIATQVLKTNTYVKQGNTLLKSFGNTLIRNVEWLISGNLINSITGVFHKAYGYTKNLDTSLNNIRIVTGASADEMARFGKEAQQMASMLGKTTTDVTNASLIYFQQGLDEEEVKRRTEITEKLSNVTGQSAEQVADQLTAVWNGMDASNDELERYADVIVKVAANTASSSSELSGAISKVAAIAKTTGVDMEQLTSMMSTVIAVTRESPETVGTAFKTIFARMDDLVEDGTDEFGVSLGRVSSHLKAMGIEILNEDGTLRDLGDTLTETGNKWSTYSKEQQIAIAEQMGGKRQWNQVLTLFNHWDEYVDTLGLAKEATGALNEQNDIAMESIEHHLNKLTTAWEGLYGELMSEDVAITVVDDFTKIVNVLGTMVKVAGGGIPLLGSLGAMLLNTFSDKVSERILSIKNNFSMMIESIRQNAAKNEISNMFGSQIANDPGMQQLVQANKEIIRYRSVMTGQDAQMKNNLLERMKNQLAEVDILKDQLKEVQAIQKEYSGVENTVMDLSDLSKVNMEELEEKIGLVKEHIGGIQTYIEELKTNGLGNIDFSVLTATSIDADRNGLTGLNQKGSSVQGLANAVKDPDRTDIELTEQQTQALERLAKAQQEYYNAVKAYNDQDPASRTKEQVQAIKDLENNYKLAGEAVESNTELMKNLTQAATHGFSNLNQEVRKAIAQSKGLSAFENGLAQSSKAANKLSLYLETVKENGLLTEQSIAKVEKAFKKIDPTNVDSIAKVWRTLRSELQKTGKDLSTVDQAIKKNLTQELKNAENGVNRLRKECEKLKQDLQFKNAVQGFTQTFSGVTQLTFAMQSLNGAFKTLEDEEATTAEKAGALLMAFSQLGNGVSATFQGLNKLKTGVQDGVAAIGKFAKKTSELDEAEKGLTATQKLANEVTDKSTGGKALNAAATELQEGAEDKHAGSTGLEAGAKTGETVAEDANTVAKGANVAMTWKQVAATAALYAEILVAIAVIAALAFAFNKIKEAEKEAEEAEKKLNKTREEFIQKNKELIKTIDENIKAWDKFSKVWDSFEEGITTIEEVKQAFQDMANQLGITQDEEYKRLMRIAEYTDDYAPLEEYLDNIIKKQKQVAAGAAEDNFNMYTDQLNEGLTDINEDIDDNRSKRLITNGLDSGSIKEMKEAADLLQNLGLAETSFDAESGILDIIKNDLSIEKLNNLVNNREEIEKMAASENEDLKKIGKYYLKIINAKEGTVSLWQDAALESIEKNATTDFTDDLGEDEVTQKVNLRKQIDERLESVAAEYEEQTGTVMTEEQKEKYHDELLEDYAEMYPSKSEIVGAIEADKSLVPALTESINGGLEAAEKTMHYSLGRITEKEAQAIEDSLNKIDLKSTNIDWSGVVKDTELMGHILQKKGQLTDEDLEKLKQYQKETGETINYLTQDYDSLIATYDGFNGKVEKGSFDAKTFDSKAFQEFFTDDVKEEMKEFYGETSEVGKAIDIVSDKSLIGTQKWKTAWETFGKGLDEIELKKKLNEFDEVIDNWQKKEKLKDGIEVSVAAHMDGDQYQKEVEQLLNQDYSITVDIDAKIDESVDKMHDELSKVSEMAGKIGENFSVSTDDLFDLLTTFPELAQNLTYLEDGTIQLSQTAIQSMIDEQKTNEKIQIQKKIDTIKEENEILQHKVDTYDKMIAAAELMASGEIDTQKEVTDTVDKLSAYSEDIQLANQYLGSIESEKISAEDIENWEKYYNKLDDENKKYWRGIIDRQKEVVANGTDANLDAGSYEFSEVKWDKFFSNEARYDYEKDGVVYGAYRVHSTEEDKNEIINRGKELIKTYTAERDAIQQILDDNKVTIAGLEAEYDAVDAKWDSLYKGMQKSADATKDNTDAVKDNAEAQQELVDLLNEEIDAYHDLNNELKILGIRLDKVKKQQSKLVDQDLKNNLNKQIDILNQYMETDQRYLNKLNTDASLKRIQLEGYGVTFNEDGAIANYSDTLLKAQDELRAKQEWYNSLSKEEQEWAKEQLEAQEKSYEQLKDLITEYEDILLEQIPNMVNDISDKFDEKIEAQISIWKIDIDLKLNEASKKRTRLEFQQFMADIAEEDILGNTAYTMNTLATYLGKNGDIQVTRQRYEELLEMKKRLEGGDTSTIYGDNMAKLQEDLDSAEQSWMESEKAAKELQKTIKDNLLKLYDQAAEKLKEQRNLYKEISDILDHDMNLIKLRFGDASFGKLSNLLEQQKQLAYKQLNSALAERDYYGEQLQKALDKDPNMKEKVTQELATHFREAVNTASSLTIELVEKIKSGFENAFNEIFANAMEKITGESSLAVLTNEWDRAKESAEKYYDTINGAYEIEKLQLQIQKEINNSNDPAYQKRLTTFMRDQVQLLRSKDKLSKYDVERANALFDIEIKRAAFQEAQNNKTKMRLRRDSSGNYSYQFVSDENNVQDAITALAEAQNKLYNIDKDAFKDNVEDVQKILSDMQQKLLEDAQNGGRRQNEIQQYYIGLITNLVKDNEEIRQNYQATTFDQLSKLTEQGIEDFYKLGQSEREALMIAQDPLFGAGLAKALEMPERFLSTLNTTVEETKELTLNYMNEFDDVMDRVEKNWEDLVKGSDPMVDGITTLTTSTEELIQQITTDTEKLVECVDQLSNHSLNLANTWELLGDAVADVLDLFNGGVGFTDSLMQILEDAKKVIKDVRNTDEMNSVSNGTNNNQTSQFNSNQNIQNKKVFSSEEWPQIGDKVRYLGGQYYEDSQGNGQAGDRGLGNFVEVYNIQKDAPYPISVISNNSAYGWLKKDQIAKFDNGGYTGNWETTKGKLAVLHPQELVLNASQTKGLVSFLNSKIHELSANALRGIVTPNIGSRHLVTESPQITNVNNIEANFPNVSVASEIEKAFMDLENLATQNAFKIYN